MLDIKNIQNPYIVEERTNNVTQLDIFSRLMMNRIITIGSEITDQLANIVIGQLLYLEHDDNTKPITLYINSIGGCVNSGNAIIDVMSLIKAPVHTICTGVAMSMAAVILSSGEKGFRKALKRSRILVHQCNSIIAGPVSDMNITLHEINILNDGLYDTLSENTGKTVEYLKTNCSKDTYFSAKEAIELGLIDSICE